jgi:hypothetical protein
MENTILSLDTETQLLISIGSAVAAGCIPCLKGIIEKARAYGIDEWKLKIAANSGQFIKDQPINMMKAGADELLGTHLMGKETIGNGTPCSLQQDNNAQQKVVQPSCNESPGQNNCGCS